MCFGSIPAAAVASFSFYSGCNGGPASVKSEAEELPAVDQAVKPPDVETASTRYPATDCLTADPWYGRGGALARGGEYGQKQEEVARGGHEVRPKFSKPMASDEDVARRDCLDTIARVDSSSGKSFPTLPSGGGSQEGRVRDGEGGRGIKKTGTRAPIRLTESRAGTRTSILTEDQAIQVFKQRPMERSGRALLCSQLAEHYGVTTTAIRHIWDRRTWVWTNLPFWNEEELAASLAEGTCENCRSQKKVERIQDTCNQCPINRKRGRPRGARDSSRRVRKNP